jgi:uncharacterized membrane protein YfcA
MPPAGLIPLLILLAISVSYIGSISGVGGGVIFTPLLLLLLPLEMPQIKIISTILVFIGSFINFFIEIIKRKVNWILFILIVPVSVPSIFLGAFLRNAYQPENCQNHYHCYFTNCHSALNCDGVLLKSSD